MIKERACKTGSKISPAWIAAAIILSAEASCAAQSAPDEPARITPAIQQTAPARLAPILPALSLDQDATAGESKTDDQPQADKSAFNLFHPVPKSLLREFNSDRPDVTESPFTVDAGHYQIELSFVEYTHDGGDSLHTDGFSVLPANLRIGLLNNLELDIMPNPYLNILTRGRGASQRVAGIGDTTLRTKLNFWGNDGGVTAGGIIPFVKIPSDTGGTGNRHVEGGVIFPLAANLPLGFDLGTMAEFDCDRNDRNDGYGVDFIHTLTVGHELFEKLSAYVEYAGISPMGTGQTYLAYFDTGVTYLLWENAQIDAGINLGLSGRADDFTVFTGLSLRY